MSRSRPSVNCTHAHNDSPISKYIRSIRNPPIPYTLLTLSTVSILYYYSGVLSLCDGTRSNKLQSLSPRLNSRIAVFPGSITIIAAARAKSGKIDPALSLSLSQKCEKSGTHTHIIEGKKGLTMTSMLAAGGSTRLRKKL